MSRGFVNQCNYTAPMGEVFTLPSRTVPDMQITLREMVDRHLRGGKVKTFAPVNVPDDSLIPIGLERMSSIDKAVLAGQVADFVATTRGRMQSVRMARQRAEFDAYVAAEADKRAADRGAAAPTE